MSAETLIPKHVKLISDSEQLKRLLKVTVRRVNGFTFDQIPLYGFSIAQFAVTAHPNEAILMEMVPDRFGSHKDALRVVQLLRQALPVNPISVISIAMDVGLLIHCKSDLGANNANHWGIILAEGLKGLVEISGSHSNS